MRNLQGWNRAPHVGESWPVASETNMDTLAKRDACERSAAAAAAAAADDALDIEDDADDAAVNTDRDFPLDVCVCPVTKWRSRSRRRRWRMSMGSDCRGGQGRRSVRIKVAAARVTRHTLRAIKTPTFKFPNHYHSRILFTNARNQPAAYHSRASTSTSTSTWLLAASQRRHAIACKYACPTLLPAAIGKGWQHDQQQYIASSTLSQQQQQAAAASSSSKFLGLPT